MLKNYFKIALRNFYRNKVYSAINIAGLTIGLACSLLIFLYVQDELSFDKFHENYEQIHRLDSKYKFNNSFVGNLDFPAGLAPILKEEVPGIKTAVRWERKSQVVISTESEKIYENDLIYTDPEFFQMFDFRLQKGNETTSLVQPYSLIISEDIAKKYLPNQDPIGKILTINQQDFTVTGVLAPIPHNTHFKFSMLASFETLYDEGIEPWSVFPNYRTYVEYEDGVSPEIVNSSILKVIQTKTGETGRKYTSIESYPLSDIYLKVESFVYDELRGNIEYVRIFFIIGFLILGIACINYMNLATARASLRSMEIGVRKVTGAYRGQLVQQFLTESILFTVFSICLSIVLIELMLPGFNEITGKNLVLDIFNNPQAAIGILIVSLFTGAIAGIYPALFLSGFKPISVLKGQYRTGKSAVFFRKTLVVVQFVITIGLIVSTIVINNQFNYLQKRGLGIDSEALISIPIKNKIYAQYSTFKNELLKSPEIENVTTGSLLLGGISFETFDEDDDVENKPKGNMLQVYNTDFDFVNTLRLKLLAGRNLDSEIISDASSSVLLNFVSIDEFGWENASDAIGKNIFLNEKPYQVVGVVQDFHAFQPTSKILPTVIKVTDTGVDQVLVRLNTKDLGKSIEYLESTWSKFEPFLPFQINFMDTEIANFYKGEKNLRTLFTAFAFLTIFIACLGLIGLSSFTAEQRRKEIGIRKVLGASIKNIFTLISKDFAYLIAVGFFIASPIAWYFTTEWIKNYSYRIEIGPSAFILGGIISISISLLMVGYQSVKAALANPVESLKNE
tara:strand:+ start:205 stop:2577 length:2373 start_codon:yes stop_codon:yes gene_type:complete